MEILLSGLFFVSERTVICLLTMYCLMPVLMNCQKVYNGPFWLIEKSKQKFWRLEFNSFEPQIIPNKSSTTLQQKTLYFQRPVFLLMQSQPYFFRKANTQKTRKGGYCLLQFSPFQKGRRNFRDSRLDRRRKKPHRVLAALNPVRRNIIARVFFTQPLNYSW